MPAKSEKQARFMRAVAHGWKPKSQKSKKSKLPSVSVARKFMKVGVHTESQKSKVKKVKTPEERADSLAQRLRREADIEMNKGIFMGPKVKKSVKASGILAKIKARKQYRAEHPVSGFWDNKSQKSQNESHTTDPNAWKRGIVTKTKDKCTMYFTGNQTSSDLKVKSAKPRK